MQLCVGTSIAIILPTTIRSFLTHQRKGLVFPRVMRLWALPAVVGVPSARSSRHLRRRRCSRSPSSLIAGFIATKFLFAGDRWSLGEDCPGRRR